ncbi:uncharacterized protein LOC141588581 [Silene latifolia]|uniref:uncharacterized protein LOC141588581 n=1 Tax=Silene latifolia TaxID=37657 RepID=UPI003D7713C3
MALYLRYVDYKTGEVKERFLGIVHVGDTTSLTLKAAIEKLLGANSLTLSSVRGQGYDGASNMRGSINGLKTLIMKESPSAYYVHCFAHLLQLTLVAVAKKNVDCSVLFDSLATLLNVIASSCKRKDILQEIQAENILKASQKGELVSGSGLNQEKGLSRPALVDVTTKNLKKIREDGWIAHMENVTSFCQKYEISVPIMSDMYVVPGRYKRGKKQVDNLHHFRIDVFLSLID